MSTENTKGILAFLQADTKENLKRQLHAANLMVMAIMDELEIKEIRVTRKTYLDVTGGLETYSDFDLNGIFIIRRTE